MNVHPSILPWLKSLGDLGTSATRYGSLGFVWVLKSEGDDQRQGQGLTWIYLPLPVEAAMVTVRHIEGLSASEDLGLQLLQDCVQMSPAGTLRAAGRAGASEWPSRYCSKLSARMLPQGVPTGPKRTISLSWMPPALVRAAEVPEWCCWSLRFTSWGRVAPAWGLLSLGFSSKATGGTRAEAQANEKGSPPSPLLTQGKEE